MARIIEDTQGKIRDLPISPKLREILLAAGTAAGIDVVRVTSGGQAKLGTKGKRKGSTRHDLGNAADLMLERAGRSLAFTASGDLPFFVRFVETAAALGASGIGAGVNYMGAKTIHVGFGVEAVWGAGGRSANAPTWLRDAFRRGRSSQGTLPTAPLATNPAHFEAPPSSGGQYVVIARGGLRLRAGPGTQFESRAILPNGTRLMAAVDEAYKEWARVDLKGDGLFDGYVFASYIAHD